MPDNKKITELPQATLPISTGVKFEAVQGGVNVQVDADDMPGSSLGYTPEDVANKSTNISLGTSDTLYPSQNAVKTYVDNKLAYDTIEVVLGALAGETIAKQIPANCTILSSTICSDVSGSMVVDIWKDTRANFPPTVADTITASAKPTLSSATLSYNNTLTGWTTTLAKGDWLIFKVDSASTLLKATVSLEILRT